MTIAERLPLPSPSAAIGIAVADTQESAGLLLALCMALEMKGVSYCYWKSSRRLPVLLEGTSDLDLLVARADRQRATAILTELGFKPWLDSPGRDHPALMSFLGYDEAQGAIRHIHVHFRLVLGHSLLKSFRLPIEERLLARSVMHASLPIRILHPADEALLLIVRANLDMQVADQIVLRRWRSLKAKYAEDLVFLRDRTEAHTINVRAVEFFSPAVAESIASRFDARSLRNGGLRRSIARELSIFRCYGDVEMTFRSAWRSLALVTSATNRRLFGVPRLPRRRAPGGGIIIAFVGVDGSGKSTQVSGARKWLGSEIDVFPLYFGTGDGAPSLFFRPFKAVARLAARLIKVKPKGASHGNVSDRPPAPLYSLLFAIWAIAVALDKKHKLATAQRAIARGFVVIADRYPQDENSRFNDGPLLHRLTWVPGWLRQLEMSVYSAARCAAPDLIIKLRVGPDAVAKREPDMRHDVILQRVAWFDDLTFHGASVVTIDGARPLPEVTQIARRAIWAVL
ncbi:hypothetical protein [Labrys miyagiensis]|uniref:hypothetical protein n=1 Tax=Labrys miyagiensis TaxID=346912 RepID=UPI0024E153FC|nr:hypothetical protein [Labrys miyagiensis]